jgi:hypothetical protein
MTNFEIEFKAVEKKIELLKIKHYKIIDKLWVELDLLKSKCIHSNLVEKTKYSESGYDYPATTTSWTQCTLCHANSDKVVKFTEQISF